MTAIGIIEDDQQLRSNILKLFSRESQVVVSAACSSIEQYVSNYESNAADVIFVDINLPGISGVDGIEILARRYPDAHIVMMSALSDDDTIWECIQRGAKGYLIKPFQLADLRSQIELVRNGGALISPEVARILMDRIQKAKTKDVRHNFDENLTAREKEVLHQLLKGFTYKEIGVALSISSTTVNDHLKKIYQKMNVRSKSELISKCLQ